MLSSITVDGIWGNLPHILDVSYLVIICWAGHAFSKPCTVTAWFILLFTVFRMVSGCFQSSEVWLRMRTQHLGICSKRSDTGQSSVTNNHLRSWSFTTRKSLLRSAPSPLLLRQNGVFALRHTKDWTAMERQDRSNTSSTSLRTSTIILKLYSSSKDIEWSKNPLPM